MRIAPGWPKPALIVACVLVVAGAAVLLARHRHAPLGSGRTVAASPGPTTPPPSSTSRWGAAAPPPTHAGPRHRPGGRSVRLPGPPGVELHATHDRREHEQLPGGALDRSR